MDLIRVACVGTGYFSQYHYDAWRRIEGVNLVASVSLSIDEAKATELNAFCDVEKMIDAVSPDLIDIITPPESHLGLIQQCAKKNVRAIICQKPFCNSIEEAKSAISTCANAGIALIVHENFRFQPWYRKMKQAIDEGLIGDVHQLTFRLRTGDGQGPSAYLDRQPYFQEMKQFLIRETGVHWIDTFRYLFGKPTAVYSDLRKLNPVIAGEDAGYFIVDFGADKKALFDANRHLDHSAENCRTTLGEALLEGNEGSISLSGNGKLSFRKFGSQNSEVILPACEWNGFAGDCVHALQSHVVRCIQEQRTDFENSAKDYLSVMALEAAIYQSAATGQKVFV